MTGGRLAAAGGGSVKVRVFDPAPGPPDPAFRPEELAFLGGSGRALVLEPAHLGGPAYAGVAGLAVRQAPAGGGRLVLMLFLRGRPRPLAVADARIRFSDFPLPASPSAAENLRQLALFFCNQAGAVVADRATATFLKSGGTPPAPEGGLDALATSFGKALFPGGAPPPAAAQVTRPISSEEVRRALAAQPLPARRDFRPMAVRVFDPDLRREEGEFLPFEAAGVGGSEGGFEVANLGAVAWADVEALALFRRGEALFLMLVLRRRPRPVLAEAREIDLATFPIRRSAPEEDLRQLALYVCQRAGRMTMDRHTGLFLQKRGRAPVLGREILALATAFGRALRHPAGQA